MTKSEFGKQSRQEMRKLGIENAADYDQYLNRKIITKDSGKRQEFETGARRDIQDGKPRFDLIPLDILDLLQQSYDGAPMIVDKDNPLHTALLPDDEVRLDLIPKLMLNRLGGLYHRGARKYSDNNWKKGIPLKRVYASMFRHMIQWAAGDTSEDHLAAVIWNATTLMWTERAVVTGDLPENIADMGALKEDIDNWYLSSD